MFEQHLAQYQKELIQSLNEIDPQLFGRFIQLLVDAYQNDRQVFICGNGGSAATANHFVCDFGKNAVPEPGKRRFRILSLSDNIEKITALGNDISFDEVFRQQLINLMRPDDLLIAVSASGNSPNIVKACEYAGEIGGAVVALAGFSGGKIKEIADVCLWTPTPSYERVEDIHLILLHMVVCCFKENPELLEPSVCAAQLA